MNDENEIHAVETDPERGENGEDSGFRFTNGDFGPHVNGTELRDFGVTDPGKPALVTDEGLPIQQKKTGKTIFLRRHIQMMAISIPTSIPNRTNTQ